MSELVIRPLQSGETQLFLSYPFARTAGLWETARDYEALLASNEYRPEHTWIALRDGIVVARACFWAGRDDRHPMSLDWLEASPGPHDSAYLFDCFIRMMSSGKPLSADEMRRSYATVATV